MKTINSMRLTKHQKIVIATIVGSPTPTLAAERIQSSPNLKASRDLLMQVGAITLVNDQLGLTSKGEALARAENIVDQTGELTPDGQQLVPTNASASSPDPFDAPAVPPADAMTAEDPFGPPPMESYQPFKLLKELLG